MISTLLPFLYIVIVSFMRDTMNIRFQSININNLSIAAYKRVFESKFIVSGARMSVMRTLLGVAFTLFCTIMTAYPLSKKRLPGRLIYTSIMVFTMFFSGGLIPTYILIKNLKLLDTIWSLVLPGLISTYNMLLMRNFFMAIPESLEESAKLDGANDFIILFRIILPVSVPIIATVALWTAVGHWNAWFDCMIYITESSKLVLQVVLRRIVLEGSLEMMEYDSPEGVASNLEAIKSATVVVTTVPIIMVYPFVQKYFIQGIMLGSLKG